MNEFEQDFIPDASAFKEGDRVRYVPGIAHGDVGHADCEDGIVTSTNDVTVFVRFRLNQIAGTPCNPADLWRIR